MAESLPNQTLHTPFCEIAKKIYLEHFSTTGLYTSPTNYPNFVKVHYGFKPTPAKHKLQS